MRTQLWMFLVATMAVASAAWAVDPADLVFYAPFEEGQGDTVADVSQTQSKGTISGEVKWTTKGKRGNALEFGASGIVEFPENPALDLSKEITMVAWIFPTDAPGDSDLFGRRNAGNTGGYTMQWTNGMVETWVWFGGWKGTRGLQASKPKVNAWHFVAGVYDGSDIIQYVDGQVDAQVKTGGKFGQIGEVFRIGQAQTGLAAMPGIIDEVAIFDRGLSADELKDVEANGVLPLAVSPLGNQTTTWAALKTGAR